MTLTNGHLRRIVAVAHARNVGFVRLVGMAELDPAVAFRGADLRGVDLRGQNLSGFDFTGASFDGALIDEDTDFTHTLGLPSGFVIPSKRGLPEMVLIPPGTFVMGTTIKELTREKVPKEYHARERPRHKVTIRRGFFLGRYPVTRGEFARFIAESGYDIPQGAYTYVQGKGWEQSDSHDWANPGFPQTDRHPVTCVSHDDAGAYVKWLSAKTGKDYRLPTEAEWEYACRAGTKTARFWGDDRDGARRYANVADLSLAREMKADADPEQFFDFDDGFPFTAPVGSFDPNPFGLHDMLGNVWEWTQDHWHENYQDALNNEGAWTGTDSEAGRQVHRGESWGSSPWTVRAGYRDRDLIGDRNAYTGFRLARTLSHLES